MVVYCTAWLQNSEGEVSKCGRGQSELDSAEYGVDARSRDIVDHFSAPASVASSTCFCRI
eukprot:6209796-Pleurochrysis_carterae.AAC.1